MNPNTRRAYERAAVQFAVWCEREDLRELADIEPHTYRCVYSDAADPFGGALGQAESGAIRMLFDWLVVGQVIAVNPASLVRGPSAISVRASLVSGDAEIGQLPACHLPASGYRGLHLAVNNRMRDWGLCACTVLLQRRPPDILHKQGGLK